MMAPYKRRRRKRHALMSAAFFLTLLWMLGIRVHLKPLVHHYFMIQLEDGRTEKGEIVRDSKDAVTFVWQGRDFTLTRGQIISMRPFTEQEVKEAVAKGEAEEKKSLPLITFRPEDNLFYGIFSMGSGPRGKNAEISGIAGMASRMTGVPQYKIEQAMRDRNISADKLSSLSPQDIEKYKKMAESKGYHV